MPCGLRKRLGASAPRRFGFGQALQWLVGLLSVYILAVLFFSGHEAEVIIGIALAAAARLRGGAR
ncbi:hypothetical protein [Streptomyces sp. NPDC059639]|uniref:hypothetical protein n=1 Tax=Streptomyces sp. NPDC059639 TaxID=3346891 RepID=UPI0036A5969A